MSIKQHLQNALASIKADKEREIAVVKEKAMRESIIPKHTEINQSRDEAIAKIVEDYRTKTIQIQEACNAEKQSIISAAEKKKTEVANAIIECESATVCAKYDKAISHLEEQIAKVEE